MFRRGAFLIVVLVCSAAARAQSQRSADDTMSMSARTMLEAEMQHFGSGTSLEPASTPVPMLMVSHNAWRLMLHANIFVADTQQQAGSEHGRDAWFSTNWVMPMAQRKLGGRGRLTLRTMFSLEPATVGRRNYPELFQQGETAFGAPIIDGQHPHDLFMEAAAMYDFQAGSNTLLTIYAAPIGDPALGPEAYPHRLSASEDPVAALGHHQQDSTHIAFNVLTGGLSYKWARVELSGFHGGEPGEQRWQPEPSSNGHAIDSVAGRLTIAPAADWNAQYSVAHITAPEALHPYEDQQRQTASVMFHHTFGTREVSPPTPMQMMDMNGTRMEMPMEGADAPMRMIEPPREDLAVTALWGRTKSLADQSKENSYLLEALLRFAGSNYTWARLENAARSNELLLAPDAPLPPNFTEQPLGHVAAFTFGYDHDVTLGRHMLAAPGAQFTIYRAPQTLVATYGAHPTAEVFFVRFRMR